MVSLVILTKNEERNIKDCLKSVSWADELIVIDDYSIDRTVEIAKKLGAKVFQHRLNNNFAQQRNFGLNRAKGEWVFFLDADERATPALAREIKKEIKKENRYAFLFKREDVFLGRSLKHGETAAVRLLRLAKKDGQWIRSVHEVWQTKWRTKELKNPLLHFSHPNLTQFIQQINFHSTLHAQALQKEGEKFSLISLLFKPKLKFCQNYFWRLGFLDGLPGLIMALGMSFHSFLAQAKLYQLEKKK